MRELYGLPVPRRVSYRQDLDTVAVAAHVMHDSPIAVLQVRHDIAACRHSTQEPYPLTWPHAVC